MFKAISLWADRVMGVSSGWGILIAALAFAVLLQWLALGLSLHRAGWLLWLVQRLQ